MAKITKLAKVGDSFSVNMYDNGFAVEISGRNKKDDWATAKVVCTTLDELVELVKELAAMERDA
jgi:hypothetical protein